MNETPLERDARLGRPGASESFSVYPEGQPVNREPIESYVEHMLRRRQAPWDQLIDSLYDQIVQMRGRCGCSDYDHDEMIRLREAFEWAKSQRPKQLDADELRRIKQGYAEIRRRGWRWLG